MFRDYIDLWSAWTKTKFPDKLSERRFAHANYKKLQEIYSCIPVLCLTLFFLIVVFSKIFTLFLVYILVFILAFVVFYALHSMYFVYKLKEEYDLYLKLERKREHQERWKSLKEKYEKVNNETTRNNNYNELLEYYKLLGMDSISKDKEKLKKNYRKLMKKYHPDVTCDDGAMAKKINSAYEYILNCLEDI